MTKCGIQLVWESPDPKLKAGNTFFAGDVQAHSPSEGISTPGRWGNHWANGWFHPARSHLHAWRGSLVRSAPAPALASWRLVYSPGWRQDRQAWDFSDTSLWGNVIAPVTETGDARAARPPLPLKVALFCPWCSLSWLLSPCHHPGDREGGVLRTRGLTFSFWSLCPSPCLPSPTQQSPRLWRALLFLLLCEGISGYRLYTDEVSYRYADSCF